MKSFRMIVWLVSALRGLHWRILAILSRSGVKISSDEGHEEVSGVIPWRMARKSSFPCKKETRTAVIIAVCWQWFPDVIVIVVVFVLVLVCLRC